MDIKRSGPWWAMALFVAALGGPVRAQTITPVVVEGDPVPGFGLVEDVSRPSVNSQGDWIASVRTTHPNPQFDGALLRNGEVLLAEGHSLSEPSGSVVESFHSYELNDQGDVALLLDIELEDGSTRMAVYFNGHFVLRSGTPVTVPGFSPGTTLTIIGGLSLNDNGDLLLKVTVDDALIPGSFDPALILLDLDAEGDILSESLVVKAGDQVDGVEVSTASAFNSFELNEAGDVAYIPYVEGLGGVVVFRDEVVHAPGDPSPVPGHTWAAFSTVRINDNGSLAVRAWLDDNAGVLLLDGRITRTYDDFVRSPFGSTRPVEYFNGLALSDEGDLAFGFFYDYQSALECIAVNNEFVADDMETLIDGDQINVPRTVDLSDNGQWMAFRYFTDSGVNGAALVDLSATPHYFCDGEDLASCPCGNAGLPSTGCDVPQATGGVRLNLLDQTSAISNRATVRSDGYPQAGAPASVLMRSVGVDPLTPVVFGDGLRCVGTPIVRLGSAVATGGAATHTFGHAVMAGAGTFFYQAWYRSQPSMFCDPAAAFNTSNGLSLPW